jgi:hypothetical protein
MRALAALRMVWARRRLGNGGGDLRSSCWHLGNVVREEAAGAARAAGPLAVSRVVNGAGDARLAREEAEDGHRKRRAENK